ncbi:MAG: hypothetical protein Q8831_02365 ['Bonamia sp.' little leaf phytoplasma]|nr:hypothetical protein ['Bonamia sp.' little leaf phytoplasma]
MNQCYIKYSCSYSGSEILDKLGYDNKTLYNRLGKKHYYEYQVRFRKKDSWYIDIK